MSQTQTITQTRPNKSLQYDIQAVNITSSTLPSYTWQQVSKHNTLSSLWCINNQYVYDITEWINKHPGGQNVLLLSGGRDITDLLISYHPFNVDKVHGILNKYCIGTVSEYEYPQFRSDTGFYHELRNDVYQYFKANSINYKSPVPGLIRLSLFMLCAIALFIAQCTLYNSIPFTIQCIIAVGFGIFQALPLLHAMHDASHCSIGQHEYIWNSIGFVIMDLFAGASMYSWLNQHVLGHHIYTNITGTDPDVPSIQSGDLRRISKQQSTNTWYQFQYIYLCILYGLLALKFRVQDITDTFTQQMNGSIRVNLNMYIICKQVFSKLFWFTWRILLPIYYFNLSYTDYTILFLLSEYVTGAYLTFNFQVSHITPDMIFPDNFDNKLLQYNADKLNEWAIHQCSTSLDYSHNNSFVQLLCGALNYQIEHHLFPSVSQYCYPGIAPIVRAKCEKYNIPYYCVDTFYTALSLHMQHLKDMGFDALHEH